MTEPDERITYTTQDEDGNELVHEPVRVPDTHRSHSTTPIGHTEPSEP